VDATNLPGHQLPRVNPLAFKSKADAVYVEVRQRILDGELPPASSLNQEQLAATLQVSTTPLREALRRLEAEGFVRTLAHREIIVAPLLVDDFTALWEVRRTVDATAAALAAERHGPDDRSRMLAAAEAMSKRSSRLDAVERNREFHTAIYCACHNPVLIEMLGSHWDRADRYRRLIAVASSAADTAAEHSSLLTAVLDRNPEESSRLMRVHLLGSQALIEQSLRANPRAQHD